jgi:signal peptidase I
MKKFLIFVWELVKIIVIALAIVIPVRYYLFQPFFVRGQSMEPNFENGDYLIVDELSYRLRAPERGEVIVFKYPNDTTQRFIKRIIGLPGETVEITNGQIKIYDPGSATPKLLNEAGYLSVLIFTSGNIKRTLGQDEYFVLGDNRPVSSDSRIWGIVPKKDIIGRVYFRAWPVQEASKIQLPNY